MATHPDFPLWKLKYTPEQVYDLFFHSNFRFLCNPKRPAICTRFGLPSDRLWRFEFVVLKGEDGDEMASPKGREKSFFPYLTHAGNDTGSRKMCNIPGTASASLGRDRSGYLHAAATSGLMAALSCVAMRRTCSSMYGFYSTLARRFSGLTLRLVGGQVISSGFRDAASLAWRLALLCRQSTLDSPRHEAVLKNWYLERKQQLEKSLALTIRNREFVTEIPSWQRQLRLGHRKGYGSLSILAWDALHS
ncbi:predicted protein [Aspergillus nidulans FGSC A4]|uniref:Uncharacterized protein n=1 Tax=Emericella nidulans (strain FGSC A4 / ATCC 38163 / CBS 112.46 / NRRL 194 / M139) TaxID=227321 RepID=Q5B747_EMENI|nr:hypothetical protein [Aspergillus nidulans FGSC A4]EAA59841.1 predicted protein [Aspergillus nidulans FGSC A4]CBF75733.1 TPA: conserved hypothetical protein [Aspergillus nidulans FGSC A4]|eukprot:XP_661237.1 predicted protein [Aspergillus nidulans FGSC A4]